MAQPYTRYASLPPARRSRLVPVGIALLAVGMVTTGDVTTWILQMSPSALKGLALIATDVFRLCVFAGAACLVIGALRNRRWKKETQVPKAELLP
jgi:hypothetical protein